MTKAATAKSRKNGITPGLQQAIDIELRFPTLSAEKRAEILDWEKQGWRISYDDHHSWNAEHAELAPGWMPHYGSLDALFNHMTKVAAGGPLNLNDEEKTKIEFVEDLEMVPGESKLVDVKLIDVSPFEAQARRRAHFKDTEIAELGQSIVATGGFIHAPVVRPKGKRFQIVAGEQRFLAAVKAGYKQVDVKVKDLTDEQVRNMQLIENLQRKDVYPVDEGFDYKDLMKLRGWSVEELSLQVGKSVDYVLNRMKLTDLVKEVREMVASGDLPLGHALEIAKFPDQEVQKEILEDCVFDWYRGPGKDNGMLYPLKDVISEINDRITLRLKEAPFDTKATNLRDDGLACVACPDRTGAAPGLFKAYDLKKDDRCLLPTCYEGKKERLVQLTREAIAHDQGVKVDEVPVVPQFGGLVVVSEKEAAKPGVVRGVSTAPHNFGKTVFAKPLPKGAKPAKAASSSNGYGVVKHEKSPAEKATFYKRKEEIWNVSVGEEVRKRVLAIAAGEFAKTFSVTGGGDTFVAAMCAKLLDLYTNDYTKRRIRDMARKIIAGHMDVSENKVDFSGSYGDGGSGLESKIAKFSPDIQKQLLYLLIHGHKGDMGGGSWNSQKAVKAMATEWGVDYRQVDARVRVDLSSKKHQKAHDEYLKAVESGAKKAELPWLYSVEWRTSAKDD